MSETKGEGKRLPNVVTECARQGCFYNQAGNCNTPRANKRLGNAECNPLSSEELLPSLQIRQVQP